MEQHIQQVLKKLSNYLLFNIEGDPIQLIEIENKIKYDESIIRHLFITVKEHSGEDSQLLIDSLLKPHLFYDGSELINQYLDLFYNPENSRFTGITSSAGNENLIYASDSYGGINDQFRLLEIKFQRSLILELKKQNQIVMTQHKRNTIFYLISKIIWEIIPRLN